LVRETVLVTGGCGFVGRHLVAALKAAEHSVRVLDIPRADFSGVEAAEAKVVKGSVVDGEALRVALGNSRVVYHMAAPDPRIRDKAFIRKMVVGGAEMLMEEVAVSKVRTVVATSTTGVYKRSAEVVDEGSPLKPGNELERAKRAMEVALAKGADAAEVNLAILRLPNVYGPGDGCLVDNLVPDVMDGRAPRLDPKGWVSTVQVDDVVTAARALAAPPTSDEPAQLVLNCVDDRPHRPEELIGAIEETLASHPSVPEGGTPLGRGGGWVKERERTVQVVERNRYSNARLKATVRGWPRFNTFEEWLKERVDDTR
jgi:nucleoside-diphosphate-sugar epimerase